MKVKGLIWSVLVGNAITLTGTLHAAEPIDTGVQEMIQQQVQTQERTMKQDEGKALSEQVQTRTMTQDQGKTLNEGVGAMSEGGAQAMQAPAAGDAAGQGEQPKYQYRQQTNKGPAGRSAAGGSAGSEGAGAAVDPAGSVGGSPPAADGGRGAPGRWGR